MTTVRFFGNFRRRRSYRCFIVDDVDAAVDAAARLGDIDRRRCRAAFERRFTSERMARDYVAVYEALLRTSRGCLGKRDESRSG